MSSSPISSEGLHGIQDPEDGGSDFNAIAAIFKSLMSRVATATIVKVVNVTNDGGVAPVGFVDVQPMINQVDGDGNAVVHGVIYGCPYQRAQGGANAVILDPQVDDIGIAVFASRDIAAVIANRDVSNPGSNGRFRMSDGMYIGGILNGVPTQWVRFSADGIEISSPSEVKLDAPTVEIDCATLTVNASMAVNITTPSFNVNGNSTLTGSVVVTEGAVFEGEMEVAGLANFNGGLNVDEVPMGPGHKHDLTGGGETLGVHV